MPQSLLEHITSASRKGKPAAVRDGDVLIVLRLEPSPNSCLVRSKRLFAASPVLKKTCTERPDYSSDFDPVRYVLVLQLYAEKQRTPQLCSAHSATNLTSAQAIIAAHRPRVGVSGGIPEQDADAWYHAVDFTIRMIITQQSPLPDNRTAANARLLIKRILQVAASIDAIPAIQPVLNNMLLRYITKKELWEAISEDSQSWLEIGVLLESHTVYDEAFKHLVGSWTPASRKLLSSVDPTLVNKIELKASKLALRRLQTERDLLLISPTKGLQQGRAVPPSWHSDAHHVVSIWHSWLRCHMVLLEDPNLIDKQHMMCFCRHDGMKCWTLPGFFKMLSEQKYLPSDFVKSLVPANINHTVLGEALSTMQCLAARLADPLTHSTLLNEDRDKFEYLTCVQVEASDIPWATAIDEAQDTDVYDED